MFVRRKKYNFGVNQGRGMILSNQISRIWFSVTCTTV